MCAAKVVPQDSPTGIFPIKNDADNFFIELDNFRGFYFPGQSVTGRVVRIVEGPEAEEIKSLQVKFEGMAKVNWKIAQWHVPGVGHKTYKSHGNQQTYIDRVILLNKQKDGTLKTSLPQGRHSFPFVYDFPTDIPASYRDTEDDAECRIYYQAKATYRIKGQTDKNEALLNLPVRRPLDLNLHPLASHSDVVEGEKYICCCCCRSGPISFKLTFFLTGFVVGENVDFLAELDNLSCRNIEHVDVWISRTVTFRGKDDTTFHDIFEQRVSEIHSLKGVKNGQNVVVPVTLDMIPKNYRPIDNFGCTFMHSTHHLHIDMFVPCGRDLTGKLPVVIGMVPFVIPIKPGTATEGQSEGQDQKPAQGKSEGQTKVTQAKVIVKPPDRVQVVMEQEQMEDSPDALDSTEF